METPEQLLAYIQDNTDSSKFMLLSYELSKGNSVNTKDLEKWVNDDEDDEAASFWKKLSESVGTITMADSFGGEGKGDAYWIVLHFEKPDCYIRVDGWYASYSGAELDGTPRLVAPQEKTIVVYE